MKKLKTNLLVVAALIIAVVTMSFKMANTTTQWHYIGNSTTEGQFRQASNWSQGAGSGCGPNGTKPCQLTANASDETELAAYLDGLSNAEVMDIVDSKKN